MASAPIGTDRHATLACRAGSCAAPAVQPAKAARRRAGRRSVAAGLLLAALGLTLHLAALTTAQPTCWAQAPGLPWDQQAPPWQRGGEAASDGWPEAPGNWLPEPGGTDTRPRPVAPSAFTYPLGNFDDEASIEHARNALGRGWGSRFPWYDEDTDEVQPIKLPPPAKQPSWNVPQLSLPGSVLTWVSWAVLLIVVLVLAWALARAYLAREKRLAAALPESQRRVVSDASRIEALPFVMRRTDTDLLGEAERCYRQGNYCEAIIYYYSYLLVALDRAQIIRLAKGKTNRQYLRELGRRQRLREILELAMVAFEDVFFGNHPLSRQRFEWCWSLLDEFHSQVQLAVPA